MKYEIGDKIIVLLSNEEGKVVEIINDKMVMIAVKGVKFPAYMDQIDFPYFKMFTQKLAEKKENDKPYIDTVKREKNINKHTVAEGVWLNFLPIYDKDVFDDDIVEKIKIYVINQTSYALNFTYNCLIGGESSYTLKNSIEPSQDFYLHEVKFEDMNDSPKFDFEFSLSNPDKKKALYYEASLKIKAKQLFKKIEEIQLKNEATFSYQLFEKYPDKVADIEKFDVNKLNNAGFRIYDASKAKQNLETARSVIDLHIEKLSDNWKHLSNFEILTIQLKAFDKFYDLAIAHYQSSLVVIHGIGVGKLRDEIHEILKTKKEVKSFINQYHPSYGYGATEIFF